MSLIFNKEQQEKATFIQQNSLSKLSELYSNEIKDLAIIWCYYSGKIEGSTYSYVETECLLKDGITSVKQYKDATILKNLHHTFISKIEYINKGKNQEVIDKRTLFRIHQSISLGLVFNEEVGSLRTRAVYINGTTYIPPKNRNEIENGLNKILLNQQRYTNPLEKAIYLHCNLARLKPFTKGNKLTARMIESIVLMNADLIPIYSTKEADIINYRKSLITFYETEDYMEYADYFLNRQIERIKAIEE